MSKAPKINLIPPEIKAKRETEKNLALLGVYTLILVGVLFVASIYVRIGISAERAKLDALTAENAALEAQIANFKEFEKKKQDYLKLKTIYDTLAGSRVSWYRFLVEIALVTPEQISVKNINVDETSCQIQAESLSIQAVSDYLVRLEELPELDDVWLDNFTVSGDKINFTIKATFNKAGAGI